MSPIINVRLSENDQFVAVDPDTGTEKVFSSIVFHDPRFIVDSSIMDYLLAAFPDKTKCDCSLDALDRMRSIADFNCLTDEVRF